jgi:hypothetical protein
VTEGLREQEARRPDDREPEAARILARWIDAWPRHAPARDREVRTADDECLGVVLTASPPVAQRDSFERESEPLASRRFPIHRLARRLLSGIRPQVQRDCQGLDHYRPTVAASKEAADRQVCLRVERVVSRVLERSAEPRRLQRARADTERPSGTSR